MIKISVAIPAYNAESYLREAVDSVLAQTLRPYEIIVVNDGSTDRTEEIALSYGDSIRYIKQANQGLAGARNTAIRVATGDWVAFFDSDDVLMPDKLRLQAAAVESNPDLILVYSGFSFLYPDGRTEEVVAFSAKDLWVKASVPHLDSSFDLDDSSLRASGGWKLSFRSDGRLGSVDSPGAAIFRECISRDSEESDFLSSRRK